jgi:putative hemolysin
MSETPNSPKLIDLRKILKGSGAIKTLLRSFSKIIARALSFDTVNDIYAQVHAQLESSENDPAFFMKTLKVMGVQFQIDAASFERIPKEGPLIVIANHPYGGIDGVVLGAMLQGARSDAKLMGNYLLSNMEGIRGSIIEVDPFERTESKRSNLAGMRNAIKWLKNGGCLGAFPAGEVSSFHPQTRSVVDSPWTTHIVNLAQLSNAQILPVYFEGRNSLLFHAMGLIHPRLRTIMLAREFGRMRHAEIKIRIGNVIAPDRIKRFDTKVAATEYLRLKTYTLRASKSGESARNKLSFPFRSASNVKTMKPLALPQAKSRIREEIENLPAAHLLVEHGDLSVYFADADKIPTTLLEIGRLREETFRAVDEGTGQERDLDDFDQYYLHLFMWDRSSDEIVGAYRIGLVDEIVKTYGKQGLYTHTLFRYKTGFLEKLGPAMELGRSFVCLKYQRKQASLALIWRGIGEFAARRPKYATLFGPVSITDAYHKISKDLMVHFLREHNFDTEMSQLVRGRKPPKAPKMLRGISLKNIGESINSVDSVSAIISGFEADAKGVPILLRHYLKLNGVLLSFNVDPAFSDVIDGLIMVDMRKTEPKILQRYFGKEAYARIMEHHLEPELIV